MRKGGHLREILNEVFVLELIHFKRDFPSYTCLHYTEEMMVHTTFLQTVTSKQNLVMTSIVDLARKIAIKS